MSQEQTIYEVGMEVRVKVGGDWGVVVACAGLVCVRHYFGTIKEYTLDKIEPWPQARIPVNPFVLFLHSVLCRLGLHAFEQEPARRDLVRSTGMHIVFHSSSIQKALQCCTRHGCGAGRKVWSEGWLGVGGKRTTPWRPLPPERERYIDSRAAF